MNSEKNPIDELYTDIMSEYDEMEVHDMISEDIVNNYNDFDEDEFEDEFDYYYETGNHEIERDVLGRIIRVRSEAIGIDLEDEEEGELMEMLADEWFIDII